MSTAYGAGKYGSGFYGGRSGKFKPRAANITVYALDGTQKAVFQLGSGSFIGLTFKYDDAGCNAFMLDFSNYVNIGRNDKIKIWIFDSADCFFAGVIRGIPETGSTNRQFQYSGYGYNDYLERINTESRTYLLKTIPEIIIDLLDDLVIPQSPIKKNLAKIVDPGLTVTEIVFNYVSVASALESLRSMADSTGDDYICGVDADDEFLFKPRSTEIKATLIVGARGKNGIQEYAPTRTNEARSRLLVFRNDGTYYGSVSTTDGTIDIFEEKITAPDMNDADIAVWAAGRMAELEQELTQAAVNWKIETQNPLRLDCDARVRIVSNVAPKNRHTITLSDFGDGNFGDGIFGGEAYSGYLIDDTLKVKSVEYKITGKAALRTIALGNVPVSLERHVYELRMKLEELEARG